MSRDKHKPLTSKPDVLEYAYCCEDQCSHCWGFFTRSGVFWDRAGVLGFLSEKLGFFFPNFFQIPNSKIGPKTPSTTPPRIHGTSSTTPPLEIGPKTPSTPPPRIHGTSSTTPPRRNRAENSINYPPLEFTEPHRLPPPPRNRAKLGQDSLIYCLLGLYHCRCEVVLYQLA